MASLRNILPQYLHTSRTTLELFDYSPQHYQCLLDAINSPSAHERMGDMGIRTSAQFAEINRSTRVSASAFEGREVTVDIDLYYLARLGGEDGPLMGGISICQHNSKAPPDIGWCMLEKYQGQGFATEAADEVLRFAREQLRITKIMAWPGKTNAQSVGVARKIGLVEGPEVKDEHGASHVVYILPGMDFDGGMTLHMFGEPK